MLFLKAFIKDANFGLSLMLMAIVIAFALITVPVFGKKSLIVRSGSMNPAVLVGDLVVVRPEQGLTSPQGFLNKYKAGDIISFKTGNKVVTHRIIGIKKHGGQYYYKTKGDANKNEDRGPVAEKDILGKSIVRIPYIGKLFAFAKTKIGFGLLVILPAALVVIAELINIAREYRRQKRAVLAGPFRGSTPDRGPTPNSFIFIKAIIPILIGTLIFPSTFAFFLDNETSTNNTFTASPIFPGAPGSVVINEINWVGSNDDGLDEWVELKNMTASPIDLTNWVVENLGTGSGPGANVTIPGGTIPANGFFLISEHNKENSKINVDSDFVTTSISLSNGGEQLVLKNDSGTTIDTANGSGAWFAGDNSTPKKSMDRKSPPSDGTISTNWQTAITHTNMDGSGPTDEFGTPKAENGT